MELNNFKQKNVEQNERATDSSRAKKLAISLWKRMKSLFSSSARLRSLNPNPIDDDEVDGDHKTRVPEFPDKANSCQPTKFKATGKRSAICAVLEEKHLWFGVPLSELRKELVVQTLLAKTELL